MFKHYWNVNSINCGLISCWNEILSLMLIADRRQCERVAVRSACVRIRSAEYYSCSNNKQSQTETETLSPLSLITNHLYLSCPDPALKCISRCVGREWSFDSFLLSWPFQSLTGACPAREDSPPKPSPQHQNDDEDQQQQQYSPTNKFGASKSTARLPDPKSGESRLNCFES